MLSRRSFFKFLGGAVAGAVAAKVIPAAVAPALDFDPEKALWVPGQKKIFIPELVGGNGFISTDAFTRETLKALCRHLTFNRWMIDDQGLMVPVTAEGYSKGYMIYHGPFTHNTKASFDYNVQLETVTFGKPADPPMPPATRSPLWLRK